MGRGGVGLREEVFSVFCVLLGGRSCVARDYSSQDYSRALESTVEVPSGYRGIPRDTVVCH